MQAGHLGAQELLLARHLDQLLVALVDLALDGQRWLRHRRWAIFRLHEDAEELKVLFPVGKDDAPVLGQLLAEGLPL